MKKTLGMGLLFSAAICYASDDVNPGKLLYTQACSVCHAPQFAKGMKAPAAFDAKAWQSRIEQASQESKDNPKKYPAAMDYLLEQVKLGKGLMHHGGLCKESIVDTSLCNDKNFKQAILYMSESKKTAE